jgi:hypothetical protein
VIKRVISVGQVRCTSDSVRAGLGSIREHWKSRMFQKREGRCGSIHCVASRFIVANAPLDTSWESLFLGRQLRGTDATALDSLSSFWQEVLREYTSRGKNSIEQGPHPCLRVHGLAS